MSNVQQNDSNSKPLSLGVSMRRLVIMNFRYHIVALLLIAFAMPCSALDIITRDGDVYQDVVVIGVDPDGAHVSHGGGVRTLDWRDLPAPLQRKYHYDAAKGRRNPKAAAREPFDFFQRAALQERQVELERKAVEERAKQAEALRAQADAEARIRAEADFQRRDLELRQREQALQVGTSGARADTSSISATKAPPSASLPYVPQQSPQTSPVLEGSHSDSSNAANWLFIGAIVALIIFAFLSSQQATKASTRASDAAHEPDINESLPIKPQSTETHQPPSGKPEYVSPWQRALVPAFKAAKWGGLLGTINVFRAQSELSIGDRFFMALIFSIAFGLLFFVSVYVIAAITYATKK